MNLFTQLATASRHTVAEKPRVAVGLHRTRNEADKLYLSTLADGPMSTTEIAAAMGITPSGCYKGLCRKEKRGIIKRVGVVDHRRHGGQSCIVWSRA